MTRKLILLLVLFAGLAAGCANAATPIAPTTVAVTSNPAPTVAPATAAVVPTAAPTQAAVPPTAAPTNAAPTASAGPLPAGVVFQVIRPDNSSKNFTLDDLKKLPLTTILADGQPQEGPSILAVLGAVNVTDYQSVSLTGVDGTYVLQRADVTPEVILDFNNRGSVKLVSPTMARDVRVRDITKIEIK